MSNFTKVSGVAEMRLFIRRIYLLGLVFVLIGGLNTFVGHRHLEGRLRQEIEQTIKFKLDQVMGETSSYMLNVERIINAAAAVAKMESDDAKVLHFFNETLLDNSSFLAMYLAASQDSVLYVNRYFDWDPVDPTTRPWYQAAVQAERLIFTNPYIDAATERWVLTMAKPIYGEAGQLVGVLGVDESLEGMLASLEKARPSENGHVYAFDGTGQALLRDRVEANPSALLGPELTGRMLSDPGGLLFTSIGGEEGYLRWQTVGSSGIVLGLFAPLKDFLDYRVLIIQVAGTALVSLVLLAVVLLAYQRRYITRPMWELDQDILAISLDEDVTYRLPYRQGSPFEHLRESINASLDRVQEHFERIVHQQEELTAAYSQLKAHELQLQEQYQEIKEDEQRIQFMADHDILTALPNRRRFEEDLTELLDTGQVGSVLLLDVDNFKHVNDTLGHIHGDAVLRHLAGTLEQNLDARGAAYRFGGDEFLVLIRHVVDPSELKKIIEQLLHNLSKPHTVEGKRNSFTTSVGVVRYPYDGTSVEQLLVKADIAMYNAKRMGRNRYVFFEASMSAKFAQQIHVQHILQEAVQTGGFKLVYQPIVDTRTGEVAYLEALIRLRDHDLGPASFIAAAEESDLIHSIGRWVIKEAIGQLAAWRSAGKGLKPISINLSPKQFYDHGFVEFLMEELQTHQIDPALLEMEITETVLIESSPETHRVIDSIRNLGVKMALDDFGTGYLSIKYITNIPVDRIKFDRSMIMGLPEIVPVMEGLISIAHSLGMAVVAEGIENTAEARTMVEVGCDYLQGYLFSQPVAANQIEFALEGNFAALWQKKGVI
ncbi:MAG: EAL domain-containing protein [Firmicutes bacterium]|nr:EAL domain-containing protein [Bacillota bacterium]